MTRTLNHVERRARKTSATIGSILGGGQVAGSVTSTSSSSSPSRVSGYSLSSANASGKSGGPHTNNNFVIDVNDPEEMGQVERNIKKRMARRDGLMRQREIER